jgi:hypothetical protein
MNNIIYLDHSPFIDIETVLCADKLVFEKWIKPLFYRKQRMLFDTFPEIEVKVDKRCAIELVLCCPSSYELVERITQKLSLYGCYRIGDGLIELKDMENYIQYKANLLIH